MNPEAVIIRTGNLLDLDALVALLKDLFSIEADFTSDHGKQREGLTKMLGANSSGRWLWVAEIKGAVIGMCSAQTLISTAEGGVVAMIEDMIVHRDWRGNGIGRRLLKTVDQWADKQGIRRLQLLSDKTNQQALDFYKKQNWRITQLICLRKGR